MTAQPGGAAAGAALLSREETDRIFALLVNPDATRTEVVASIFNRDPELTEEQLDDLFQNLGRLFSELDSGDEKLSVIGWVITLDHDRLTVEHRLAALGVDEPYNAVALARHWQQFVGELEIDEVRDTDRLKAFWSAIYIYTILRENLLNPADGEEVTDVDDQISIISELWREANLSLTQDQLVAVRGWCEQYDFIPDFSDQENPINQFFIAGLQANAVAVGKDDYCARLVQQEAALRQSILAFHDGYNEAVVEARARLVAMRAELEAQIATVQEELGGEGDGQILQAQRERTERGIRELQERIAIEVDGVIRDLESAQTVFADLAQQEAINPDLSFAEKIQILRSRSREYNRLRENSSALWVRFSSLDTYLGEVDFASRVVNLFGEMEMFSEHIDSGFPGEFAREAIVDPSEFATVRAAAAVAGEVLPAQLQAFIEARGTAAEPAAAGAEPQMPPVALPQARAAVPTDEELAALVTAADTQERSVAWGQLQNAMREFSDTETGFVLAMAKLLWYFDDLDDAGIKGKHYRMMRGMLLTYLNPWIDEINQLQEHYQQQLAVIDGAAAKEILQRDRNGAFLTYLREHGPCVAIDRATTMEDKLQAFGVVLDSSLKRHIFLKNFITKFNEYREAYNSDREIHRDVFARSSFLDYVDVDSHLTFLSFLIKPQQRGAKYHLIVRDLSKYVKKVYGEDSALLRPRESEDSPLTVADASRLAEEYARQANEEQRSDEGFSRTLVFLEVLPGGQWFGAGVVLDEIIDTLFGRSRGQGRPTLSNVLEIFARHALQGVPFAPDLLQDNAGLRERYTATKDTNPKLACVWLTLLVTKLSYFDYAKANQEERDEFRSQWLALIQDACKLAEHAANGDVRSKRKLELTAGMLNLAIAQFNQAMTSGLYSAEQLIPVAEEINRLHEQYRERAERKARDINWPLRTVDLDAVRAVVDPEDGFEVPEPVPENVLAQIEANDELRSVFVKAIGDHSAAPQAFREHVLSRIRAGDGKNRGRIRRGISRARGQKRLTPAQAIGLLKIANNLNDEGMIRAILVEAKFDFSDVELLKINRLSLASPVVDRIVRSSGIFNRMVGAFDEDVDAVVQRLVTELADVLVQDEDGNDVIKFDFNRDVIDKLVVRSDSLLTPEQRNILWTKLEKVLFREIAEHFSELSSEQKLIALVNLSHFTIKASRDHFSVVEGRLDDPRQVREQFAEISRLLPTEDLDKENLEVKVELLQRVWQAVLNFDVLRSESIRDQDIEGADDLIPLVAQIIRENKLLLRSSELMSLTEYIDEYVGHVPHLMSHLFTLATTVSVVEQVFRNSLVAFEPSLTSRITGVTIQGIYEIAERLGDDRIFDRMSEVLEQGKNAGDPEYDELIAEWQQLREQYPGVTNDDIVAAVGEPFVVAAEVADESSPGEQQEDVEMDEFASVAAPATTQTAPAAAQPASAEAISAPPAAPAPAAAAQPAPQAEATAATSGGVVQGGDAIPAWLSEPDEVVGAIKVKLAAKHVEFTETVPRTLKVGTKEEVAQNSADLCTISVTEKGVTVVEAGQSDQALRKLVKTLVELECETYTVKESSLQNLTAAQRAIFKELGIGLQALADARYDEALRTGNQEILQEARVIVPAGIRESDTLVQAGLQEFKGRADEFTCRLGGFPPNLYNFAWFKKAHEWLLALDKEQMTSVQQRLLIKFNYINQEILKQARMIAETDSEAEKKRCMQQITNLWGGLAREVYAKKYDQPGMEVLPQFRHAGRSSMASIVQGLGWSGPQPETAAPEPALAESEAAPQAPESKHERATAGGEPTVPPPRARREI